VIEAEVVVETKIPFLGQQECSEKAVKFQEKTTITTTYK
jgi:hypothetical protein